MKLKLLSSNAQCPRQPDLRQARNPSRQFRTISAFLGIACVVFALRSAAEAAPYYNIAADVWMDGEEVCLSCTSNNGYARPPVKDGYYFDKRYQVWRNQYGICQACIPATGFDIPPKDLPADESADSPPESEDIASSAATSVIRAEHGDSHETTEVRADPERFRDCESLASRIIKGVVRDSGRVFLEDNSSNEKPTTESYNGMQFTTVLTGVGQFQIPNGWMRFAYNCYFEQERAAVFDWKRLQVLSWEQ